MKKEYLLFTILLVLLISLRGYTQEDTTDSFKPYGKPILKVFTNFHTSVSEGIDDGGFEIRRAYFGYQYFLTPKYEIAVKLDIGSPNDASEYSLLRRFAYFKNAYIKYTHAKLTTQFGIIDVRQFVAQEKYWAHRYIERSFMDKFRFGPKADLGWNIIYKFHEKISADFGIYNGEGYTKLQADNAFKSGLGISLFPYKGFILRLYGDYIKKGVVQSTLSGFIGYKYKDKFIGGVEYNYQINFRYHDGQDKYGYSVYASYNFTEKWQLFGRFDQVYSNIPEGEEQPWSLLTDGSAIIGGLQFSPIPQINIALNYQDWVPYAKNMKNEAYIYLNFEFKL